MSYPGPTLHIIYTHVPVLHHIIGLSFPLLLSNLINLSNYFYSITPQPSILSSIEITASKFGFCFLVTPRIRFKYCHRLLHIFVYCPTFYNIRHRWNSPNGNRLIRQTTHNSIWFTLFSNPSFFCKRDPKH